MNTDHILTDPARELAELLTSLQSGNVTVVGSQFLADKFEVEAWSQDFYDNYGSSCRPRSDRG
jgi:hypothetical protein